MPAPMLTMSNESMVFGQWPYARSWPPRYDSIDDLVEFISPRNATNFQLHN